MAILQVNYVSDALFRMVTLNVVLPIDKVDPNGAYINGGKKFKTLYLLHGLLGNYTDWVHGTRVQRWAMEHDLAVVMKTWLTAGLWIMLLWMLRIHLSFTLKQWV